MVTVILRSTAPRRSTIKAESFDVPSASPRYDSRSKTRLNAVLERGYTAEGGEARQLEEQLSTTLDRRFCNVTSSGTTALHLTLEALGVGQGDEVIIPSYTCFAVMNAVCHTGATPVPVDVNEPSLSLSHETIRPRLNERTAAVIVVHNFGYPVTDGKVYELDVPILDDISTALGASEPTGNPAGTRGMASVGSMYATKLLSAGYGGFISTDDPSLNEEIEDLKRYDERDSFRVTYNYGLSDVLAVLGLDQLKKLPQQLDDRQRIVRRYDEQFTSLESFTVPDHLEGRIYYRYVVRTPHKEALIDHLQSRGIEAKSPVYKPLHRYDNVDVQCKTTEDIQTTALLLPCHSGLSNSQTNRVIQQVHQFFDASEATPA